MAELQTTSAFAARRSPQFLKWKKDVKGDKIHLDLRKKGILSFKQQDVTYLDLIA